MTADSIRLKLTTDPLGRALLDDAGHALTRWSGARFGRCDQLPRELRGPPAMLVLRDWLVETGTEEEIRELEEVAPDVLSRLFVALAGYNSRLIHDANLKPEHPTGRNARATRRTALNQVHIHGRVARAYADEGRTEDAKRLRAHRRVWVRRALELRSIERETGVKGVVACVRSGQRNRRREPARRAMPARELDALVDEVFGPPPVRRP